MQGHPCALEGSFTILIFEETLPLGTSYTYNLCARYNNILLFINNSSSFLFSVIIFPHISYKATVFDYY